MKLNLNIDGQITSQEFLEGDSLVIGRGSDAQIKVLSPGISRKHLKIEMVRGKIYLTDLGSKNGTKVGPEQLPPGERTEYITLFMPIELSPIVHVTLE